MVRSYDAHPDKLGTPVTGDARITVDFSAATVDVDFTNFTRGHADVSWDDLALENGRFGYSRGFSNTIIGASYGPSHEAWPGSSSAINATACSARCGTSSQA